MVVFDSEGEQLRISKMTLDLPVGSTKCIINTDVKYTNKGALGLGGRTFDFQNIASHFSLEGNISLSCFHYYIDTPE